MSPRSLALLVFALSSIPGVASAQVCSTEAGLSALERDGDSNRGRLLSTLARTAAPALTSSERAARCRYQVSMRVVRRADASCQAIVAVTPALTGCGLASSAPEKHYSVTSDARGRLTGRPMSSQDPRLLEPRFDASTPLTASCAAYESDTTIGPAALTAIRSPSTHFTACEALGLPIARIRSEVVSCLENHRSGDAVVSFNEASGAEACRVVVRTERVGGSPFTRVSTSASGSSFVHSFLSGTSNVCESYGPVDEAGCARGRPLRRATDASCPLPTPLARTLASSPAFLCVDDAELRGLRVLHAQESPGANPTAFRLMPVFGVLSRGRSALEDAAVNQFVDQIASAATDCPMSGAGPAGRHRTDVLLTFTIGPTGVGAIQTAAASYDQGVATCLVSAARANQASIRATVPSAPPIYQYTIAVLRP